MATVSGKIVSVPILTGAVSPKFHADGPHVAGLMYTFSGGTGNDFSLLADELVSVANGQAVQSDVQICITNAKSHLADVSIVVTRHLETLADVQIEVTNTDDSDATSASSTNNPALEFLGKGLKFPFTFQKRSGGAQISTATSSDHAHIHESIRQILGTKRGERFMRPDFGTRLHELVFEPNDQILYGLIRHEVTDALDTWEPRIVVTDVSVGSDENDEHLVLVNISYRLISAQIESNFVYPFYRELE
ncbi:MAG: GPW/gp25 family protein [Armatimonadota bacterium]|nr:GPW/gp25 family protein [bacterium]